MTTATPVANGHTMTTAREVRILSRSNKCGNISGMAPRHLQTDLIVLTSRSAADFRLLCMRNTVPCPLIAESVTAGESRKLKSCVLGLANEQLVDDLDIRSDAPKYNVYIDGKLTKSGCCDTQMEWTSDHVAFLIGCSFSFEPALQDTGLEPPHTARGRNVPMYRTSQALCPAGVFGWATFVVSMRSYALSEVERVRNITRPHTFTHGEPIDWGWYTLTRLGIEDMDRPQWGDAPLSTVEGRPLRELTGREAEVTVFWKCGVIPQEAVMQANFPGVVMAHAAGYMILLDVLERTMIIDCI